MSGGGAQRRSPLVSVVTPVFNGGKYLRECIESVLAQTYDNWDYTIVDNCSTDHSLAIASEYATRYPQIKIRTNEKFVGAIENQIGRSARSLHKPSTASSFQLTIGSTRTASPSLSSSPNATLRLASSARTRRPRWEFARWDCLSTRN